MKIERSDYEITRHVQSCDTWCDWCGGPIYRGDTEVTVICFHRGWKGYCSDHCEEQSRERSEALS